MKKIVSAVLVFVMMLSLAGCGISYDDIKGDWTAKTINGMTIDEYAASLGVDPSQDVYKRQALSGRWQCHSMPRKYCQD